MQVVAAPNPGRRIGVNGPERRFANLLGAWSARGIEPVVLYPRRGRLWRRFEEAGVPLIDFEVVGKFDWRGALGLARHARRLRADLIHTQGPGSLDAIAALAGRCVGLPVVVTRPVMIEDLVISRCLREVYRRIDLVTLRVVDRVIAVSDAGGRHLVEVSGLSPNRVDVVYNGVDTERFAPRWQRVESLRLRRPTIGMVAQLTRPKGWHDFLAVARRIAAYMPDVRAVIVGDGPLRRELEQAACERELAGIVEFAGHREDVAEILGELDVFVFTSHREGLSVAVLEAMASGLPVVATETGAIREQVTDGENGFVVPVGDIAGLAAHCLRLLDCNEQRLAFGHASRRRVETSFSESAMADRYAWSYRTTIAVQASGRRWARPSS
ncbi:MAG: glycosyltransferase [Acidobacteriota bacterium]